MCIRDRHLATHSIKNKNHGCLGKLSSQIKHCSWENSFRASFRIYLLCHVSIRNETGRDTSMKLCDFKWCVPSLQKTSITFYKAMALPMLLYGCETYVSTGKVKNQIQSIEMSFLRWTKRCTRRVSLCNVDQEWSASILHKWYSSEISHATSGQNGR